MSKNESTALVKNKNESYESLSTYLASKQSVIANLFVKGSQLDAGRMVRLTLSMCSRQPDLLDCSPQSMLLALMDSAHYNLEPNPVLGHAFVIPYWNSKRNCYEAQFQIGYKGLIVLAHRSGVVFDIDASVVHEKDKFKIHKQKMPQFTHEPFFGENPGPAIGAYAVGYLKNGHQKFLALTTSEIEKYRRRGFNKKGGPWDTDWDAMAKKTVIRRLCSTLPLDASHELATALAQERESELAGYATYVSRGAAEIEGETVTQLPARGRGEELTARLNEKRGRGAPPAEQKQAQSAPPPPPAQEQPPARQQQAATAQVEMPITERADRAEAQGGPHGNDNVGF